MSCSSPIGRTVELDEAIERSEGHPLKFRYAFAKTAARQPLQLADARERMAYTRVQSRKVYYFDAGEVAVPSYNSSSW